MGRLWYLDHTGEVMQNLLDEYSYRAIAEKKMGNRFRIEFLESFFAAVVDENCMNWRRLPMDYDRMKDILKVRFGVGFVVWFWLKIKKIVFRRGC